MKLDRTSEGLRGIATVITLTSTVVKTTHLQFITVAIIE